MNFARFVNFINFNVSITKYNFFSEKFKTPCIIISNHISFVDIIAAYALTPRLIVISNDVMVKSRYNWLLNKYSNLLMIDENLDAATELLRNKTAEGYSVLIFPEGMMSSFKIKRFHKGAFKLSEQLNLDILPILMIGHGDFLKEKSIFRHEGKLQLLLLQRIKPDNHDFGHTYSEKARNICNYFREMKEKHSF